MPAHAPTQDAPITTATIRRLLTASAVGCVLVAVASLLLTAGLGTPTAAVFATIAGAIVFAGVAFDVAETRAARRAQPTQPAVPEPVLDPEKTHDLAIALVSQALTDAFVDDDPAALAVETLLEEPELLASLAALAAALEPPALAEAGR